MNWIPDWIALPGHKKRTPEFTEFCKAYASANSENDAAAKLCDDLLEELAREEGRKNGTG